MYLQIMVPIHKPCPLPENKFLNKQGCAVSILLIQLPNDVITKYYHIIYTNRRRLEFVFESLRIQYIKYCLPSTEFTRFPGGGRPLITPTPLLGGGDKFKLGDFSNPFRSVVCPASSLSLIYTNGVPKAAG